MIIDWHTHVHSEREQAMPRWKGQCPATIDNVLRLHDEVGLDLSVISNSGHYLKDFSREDDQYVVTTSPGESRMSPYGPVKLDAYDNPIQNIYITQVRKQKHPVLGDILVNVPIKTYENVSQFWSYKPEEFLKRGPYQR